MSTWNSRGLRGSTFEDLINSTNEYYRKHKLALVQKIPTPITPLKFNSEKKLITEADAKQLKEGVGSGGSITVPKGTLVTPAAKDVFNGSRITVTVAK